MPAAAAELWGVTGLLLLLLVHPFATAAADTAAAALLRVALDTRLSLLLAAALLPRSERLYMGTMARHSEVMLQPGHKWNNAVFYNHTGACCSPAAAARVWLLTRRCLVAMGCCCSFPSSQAASGPLPLTCLPGGCLCCSSQA